MSIDTDASFIYNVYNKIKGKLALLSKYVESIYYFYILLKFLDLIEMIYYWLIWDIYMF